MKGPVWPRRGMLGLAMLLAAVLPLTAWAGPAKNVADGIYLIQGPHEAQSGENLGAVGNRGFVVGDRAVAVIDTGGSFKSGQRLRAAIRKITDLPIRFVINTHVHPDHVLGNAAFLADKPQFIGHANLPRALAERGPHYLARLADLVGEGAAGTQIVPVTKTVEKSLVIDLGGRTLEIVAHGAAHTDNDLTVRDSKTGVLWLSDLLFVERIPVLDGSLAGWLGIMDSLAKDAAPLVVPGHGPASREWKSALADQYRYFKTLGDEIRAVIAKNGGMEEALKTAGQSEKGKWLLFDDNHGRNVVTAFAEIEWE